MATREKMANSVDFQKKSFLLSTVFNPSAPINKEELFAGRVMEVRLVVDAINQPGQHVVLYGQRGVGKTSLGNMIPSRIYSPDADVLAPQINCMTTDSFSDIWKRVFEEIAYQAANRKGEISLEKTERRLLKGYTGPYSDAISPDIVRRVLSMLGEDGSVVIILDEFDKVESADARATMS